MKKTHILVTLAFDDDSPDVANIDTELSIQHDITKLLQKYHHDKLISHYVVADNEVISEKLKSDDIINYKELLKLADFHSIKLSTNEGESKYLSLEELEKIIFEMQEGKSEEHTEKELIPKKIKVDIKNNRLTAYKVKGVLSTRTCAALLRAGFYTVGDLTYVDEFQIKQIRQIGKTAYEEIQRFCNDYGINIGSNSGKVPSFSKGDIVVSVFDTVVSFFKNYTIYDSKRKIIPKGTKFEIVEINTQMSDAYLPNYLCRLIESDDDKDLAFFELSQIAKI